MERLKEWHVFDPDDFDGISIDVTKWEEDLYGVVFNFYCTQENEEEPNVGFTLCTMIIGSTLQECHERIMEVLNTGMLDGIDVSSHGTLYDKEGEELQEICWNEFAEDDQEEVDETSPTLH